MTDNTKDKYVKLSMREHVLLKPSMYLGDSSLREEENFIYEDGKIIKKTINWSPALYKIFDEIIVNAYDQTIRDKNLTYIKVKINKHWIEVENDGVGIDVYVHKQHKIYIPELIFGNPRTSTNFNEDENRITGGSHGLGAKLTNIFSTKFSIEVIDSSRGLKYTQDFKNNLKTIEKPHIEKINSNKKGGFKVRFYPDFKRFGLEELDEDHEKLFTKRVYDLCGLTNKSIYLNDKKLEIEGWNNYMKLYENGLIEYKCNKYWELGYKIETNAYQVSFVNGIFTNNNGKHVEYIYEQIFQKLIKKNPDITRRWLRGNITMILKSSVINPSFNSQTKEELTTPTSKLGITCDLGKDFYDKFNFKKLEEMFKKQSKILFGKVEGSKKSKIKNISKLEDANFAGTKRSTECTLILTEGDSAKATAISGISAVQNGRDYFGVFPLRGKLINVRDISIKKINKNEEITNLKKILGLKSNVKYTKENLNELRYGSIMLMMDADEDGSHIKGLVLNFLSYFYPSLLKIDNFIKVLITPVVRATYKNEVLTFRNQSDYLAWRNEGDKRKYKIKYYKGLGTSTRKEAEEYFKNIDNNTQFIYSKKDIFPHPELELAFRKKDSDKRREWLKKYNMDERLVFKPQMKTTISQFIHLEMKHFSNYDNIRSIPSIVDGFKPSQRKVLYACLKRNLFNEMKVAQLSGYVAEVTSYHHGEASLTSTIIKLAQDYTGSNNINFLKPNGQFGTRLLGGKDHSSPRYIFTELNNIVKYIFRKEDDGILEFLDDDGFKIEPKYYFPIIPTILLNGSEGIGTGFSTFVPNYSVKDLITLIKNKINKIKGFILEPKYENFKGQIFKINNFTYGSKGKFYIEGNKLFITELPIKTWTTDYKSFLEQLIYDNNDPFFNNFTNQSSDRDILFILKIRDLDKVIKMKETEYKNGVSLLEKHLKLSNYINVSNMNLFDSTLDIKNYSNANKILDEFYNLRLTKYLERKNYLLKKLKIDLNYTINKVSWLKDILSGKIDLRKKTQDELLNYLKFKKVMAKDGTYDYLLNISIREMSKDNVKKLEDKILDLKKQINKLQQKTPEQLWLDDLNDLEKILKN